VDEANGEALTAGGDQEDPAGGEEDSNDDDPPLDEEAIDGLKTDAYNELALLGEPVPEASKVRLFCKSLKEKFMKASAIDTQMNKETGSRFALAMAHLKSVRDLHIADGAEKEERQVSELGKHQGGGDGPKDKRKKKGGGAGV
jgi:hypothetical protein